MYRLGGAQAVAALAYGVEGLAGGPLVKVDKIVGPGNQFVALAKKLVFGEVDIDSIAGPSEVVVIADETTRPEYRGGRLNRPGRTCAGLQCPDHVERSDIARGGGIGEAIAAVDRAATRAAIARSVRCVIMVGDREEAAELANTLATEHLHIACETAGGNVGKIRNAGAVFFGPFSPVALGDYVAGPSHVLPTGATARFASGLSSNDFLRSNSVIQFTREGLNAVADDAMRMARARRADGARSKRGDAEDRLKPRYLFGDA